MTNVLEVFTDFVCPWCYLAEKQLKQAIHDIDLTVQYIYFPLHPETPVTGMTLEKLFAGRGLDVSRSQEQLASMMRGEGLVYGPRTHTYNSRRAQQLVKYIEKLDADEDLAQVRQFRDGVFMAYFGRGKNIADPGVLQGICRQIVMEEFDVEQALSDTTAAAAVDDDWAYCRKMNLSGVPAFRYGEHWVHGCRGVAELESLIRVERAE